VCSVKVRLDRSRLVARPLTLYDWRMKAVLASLRACLVAGWCVLGCGSGGDDAAGTRNGGLSPDLEPGCKRGVAWPGQRLTNTSLSLGLSWWYNWGLAAEASPAGVAFEPMVWGDGFNTGDAANSIPQGAGYLLGFNAAS
jgi:hypothetical protein